jgi:cysteine desulfurase
MSDNLVYFDYAATTPLAPSVQARMLAAFAEFGNPASLHHYGKNARAQVDEARAQVAQAIGASADEIIWTSGATEANNLALKGLAEMYGERGKHIITLKTEHKSILDVCQALSKRGFSITYLTPQSNGLMDLAELEAALTPETLLVSVMHVNNEVGVIQDIAAIAELIKRKNKQTFFHVDAAQSVGKIPLDVSQMAVDAVSLSAHKAYGPKGIGALYLRRKPRVRVMPLLHGGGHEQGMRSGTLPTVQIVGMGEAFALAKQSVSQDYARILSLREQLCGHLQNIKTIQFNVAPENCVPHIINLRFENMLADEILRQLPIAASTGSACQGYALTGSYVLQALQLNAQVIQSSLRISFGRYTTQAEVERLGQDLLKFFS